MKMIENKLIINILNISEHTVCLVTLISDRKNLQRTTSYLAKLATYRLEPTPFIIIIIIIIIIIKSCLKKIHHNINHTAYPERELDTYYIYIYK